MRRRIVRGLGGIWEQRDDGETLAIVTTPADEFVAPVHQCTPLTLTREAHQLWLFAQPDEAARLMVPAPGTSTAAYYVDKLGAGGAEPIAAAE